MYEIFLEGSETYLEASSHSTKFITNEIYTRVEKILSTSQGQNKFKSLVGNFIDRNSSKLYTAGPQYMIAFSYKDKDDFFDLFDIKPEEITEVIIRVTKVMNDKSDWKLIRDNPVFIIFMCSIRYYLIHKNESMLNLAMAIFAIAMYPSIFTKYFSFEPSEAVMQYTIDSLSLRSTIKKEKHLFGTLMSRVTSACSFHEKFIIRGDDADYINFLIRLRNDYNSFMKKISNEFYDNHKKGLGVYTQTDSYEDNNVVDTENDTNRVSSIAEKVSMNLIIHGIDLKLAEASATACSVHVLDLRNYLMTICNKDNQDDMIRFIEAIVFLYIYESRQPVNTINSKAFLEYSLLLYKKANSKNENIVTIKHMLTKWSDELGITKQYSSPTSLNSYKRAIYMFFVFIIQKYN